MELMRAIKSIFSDTLTTRIVEDTHKSYDMELLKESVGDNPQTLSEIMRCFLKDIPGLLHRLEQAVADNNKPQIASAAHSLKGNLKLLGMDETYDRLREIEQIGKDPSTDAQSSQLKKQWKIVKETFAVVLDEMSKDLELLRSA